MHPAMSHYVCPLGHPSGPGQKVCPLCGSSLVAAAGADAGPVTVAAPGAAQAVSERPAPVVSPDGHFVWIDGGWQPLPAPPSGERHPVEASVDVPPHGAGQPPIPGSKAAVSNGGWRKWRWLVGGVALTALSLGAVVAANAESGQPARIVDAKVGECFNLDGESQVRVPCSQPHQLEAYFAGDLGSGPYPGQEDLDEAIDGDCMPKFFAFIGGEPQDKIIYVRAVPTEEEWADGHHRGACLVAHEDQETKVGTARGSSPDATGEPAGRLDSAGVALPAGFPDYPAGEETPVMCVRDEGLDGSRYEDYLTFSCQGHGAAFDKELSQMLVLAQAGCGLTSTNWNPTRFAFKAIEEVESGDRDVASRVHLPPGGNLREGIQLVPADYPYTPEEAIFRRGDALLLERFPFQSAEYLQVSCPRSGGQQQSALHFSRAEVLGVAADASPEPAVGTTPGVPDESDCWTEVNDASIWLGKHWDADPESINFFLEDFAGNEPMQDALVRTLDALAASNGTASGNFLPSLCE